MTVKELIDYLTEHANMDDIIGLSEYNDDWDKWNFTELDKSDFACKPGKVTIRVYW